MQFNKKKLDKIEIVPNRYIQAESIDLSLKDILNEKISSTILIEDVQGKHVFINNNVFAEKIGELAKALNCDCQEINTLIESIKKNKS